MAEQLTKLSKLKDQGILTEDEFSAKKKTASRSLVTISWCSICYEVGTMLRTWIPLPNPS
ncbi:MAG: SHOCT domain-containing protein [Candidatus Saccharibacteria bacterium]